MTTEVFWSDYSRLVANLLPPLMPGDGVAEAELETAEARLGMRLPELLREFYLRTGRRKDINDAVESLLPPEYLSLDGHVLTFYAENQSVVLWAVDLSNPDDTDPPVLELWPDDPEPEDGPLFPHLSQFLFAMLLRQIRYGVGMPHFATGMASASRVLGRAEGWESVAPTEDDNAWQVRALVRDGQVLIVEGVGPRPEVYGGGRTAEDLQAIGKAFGVEWD